MRASTANTKSAHADRADGCLHDEQHWSGVPGIILTKKFMPNHTHCYKQHPRSCICACVKEADMPSRAALAAAFAMLLHGSHTALL
jgi:hypothetical protein